MGRGRREWEGEDKSEQAINMVKFLLAFWPSSGICLLPGEEIWGGGVSEKRGCCGLWCKTQQLEVSSPTLLLPPSLSPSLPHSLTHSLPPSPSLFLLPSSYPSLPPSLPPLPSSLPYLVPFPPSLLPILSSITSLTCDRFAQLAATVLVNKEFNVYLFSTITPTPFTVSALRKMHGHACIHWCKFLIIHSILKKVHRPGVSCNFTVSLP